MSLIKNSLDWLIQASPLWLDGDTDKHVNHLHVIDGMGYATDGHRVHVAPVVLADGAYNPLTMELVDASKLIEKKDIKGFVDNLQNSPRHTITKVQYGDFERLGDDGRILRLRRGLKEKAGWCCFKAEYVRAALNSNSNIDLCIVGMGTTALTMFGEHTLGRFCIAGTKPKET